MLYYIRHRVHDRARRGAPCGPGPYLLDLRSPEVSRKQNVSGKGPYLLQIY